MNLKEIADLIGGTVKGDEKIQVTGVSGIENAGEGQITYCSKANKYIDLLRQSKATAVIVEKEIDIDKAQVITRNAALGFARVLARFYPDVRVEGRIDTRAAIGQNVKLGKNVTVSAFVSLADSVTIEDDTVLFPGVTVGEGCSIGNHCTLHPNVTLYGGTVIGNHVTLHAGAVIGADGFGYVPDENGHHFKIKQVGRVVIEDYVEVGANTCIDRAAMKDTLIKKGTKIDNLVQIAHNCTIGEHSIVVSQAGIAGSCTLGHHVIIGGQVGIADHVVIGDQAAIQSQSGVYQDVESKSILGGTPALPRLDYGRQLTHISKLPELSSRVKELEKKIDLIEKK